VNDRAVSGRQYLAGGKLNEYFYSYDNENRLSSAEISLKTGTTTNERHFYSFVYDAGDHVMEIRFRRMVGTTNQDSISLSKTYYEDKKFITWQDLGFDHFGSTTVSVESFGYGTVLPQLFGLTIKPNSHALKTTNMKSYIWNPGTAKWQLVGVPGEYTYNEDNYKYDEAGLLSGYGSMKISWQ
jgi:hypothetical protein